MIDFLSCVPSGTSWLQGDPWTCRNRWASCKNTPILLSKTNTCLTQKKSQAFSGLFAGWRGASGTTGRIRRQGRQGMVDLLGFFPHFRSIGKSSGTGGGGIRYFSNLQSDQMFWDCVCLQGSRGIQGPQGAVGKKGENVSEATQLVVLKCVRSNQHCPSITFSLFRVYQVLMEKMAHLVFLD